MKLHVYLLLFFATNSSLLSVGINRQDSLSVSKVLFGFSDFNLKSKIDNKIISNSKFKISDFNFEFNSIRFNQTKDKDITYDFDIIGPLINIRGIKNNIHFEYFGFCVKTN